MTVRYAFRDKTGRVHRVTHLSSAEKATVLDLKSKIAQVTRIPVKWQSLLVGHPPREVVCDGLLGDAIVSGSMITVRDARPRDDEKEVHLAPSLIRKTLRGSEILGENVLNTQNSETELGQLVEVGGVKIPFHPDPVESKYVAGGLSFETLASGNHCKIKKEAFFTVKNKSEFFTKWKRSLSGLCPTVTFSDSMIMFLFMGERESGGYGIVVSQVLVKNANVLVYYHFDQPRTHEKIVKGKTYPYHVVRVERSMKPIKYIYRAD